MTLRIDGAGFNLAVAGGRDPVLSAGGVYLIDDRTRYVRPGLSFSRSQQVYIMQANGSLSLYTGSQVPWGDQGIRLDPGWVQRALSTDSFTTAAWTASAAVVTDNAYTAQDGTVYAKLAADATNATHLVRQTITYTAGEVTTIAFLLRPAEETVLVVRAGSGGTVWGSTTPVFATFDATTGIATTGTHGTAASMQRLHGDAWLCSVTTVATTAAGNAQVQLVLRQVAAYLGDGTSGLFVDRFNVTNTTYRVPLTTATASAVTVPNFSFFGLLADMGITLGSEYTLGVEYTLANIASGYQPIALALSNNTAAESVYHNAATLTASREPNWVVNVASVNQASSTGVGPSSAVGQLRKTATRIKANDFRASYGGVLSVQDTTGTLPTVDRLFVGLNWSGNAANAFQGHIRKLWLVPSLGLSDTQLQALSF